MKEYQFTVYLVGCGETVEEAWEDVCHEIKFGDCNYIMPEEYELTDEWDDD